MNKWIKCSERMPQSEEGIDLLVYRPSAHEPPGRDLNVTIKRYSDRLGFSGLHEVTHWMPLPAPPSNP